MLRDVRALFEEYVHSLGVDLGFQGFAEELAGLPGDTLEAMRPARALYQSIGFRPIPADR